jgi:hypothetical protein
VHVCEQVFVALPLASVAIGVATEDAGEAFVVPKPLDADPPASVLLMGPFPRDPQLLYALLFPTHIVSPLVIGCSDVMVIGEATDKKESVRTDSLKLRPGREGQYTCDSEHSCRVLLGVTPLASFP